MRYRVTMTVELTQDFVVEAANESEAEDKAMETISDNFPYAVDVEGTSWRMVDGEPPNVLFVEVFHA